MFDVQKIRENFPILSRQVYGKPLVYLDNAATTQKPLCVLDAMRDEYLKRTLPQSAGYRLARSRP